MEQLTKLIDFLASYPTWLRYTVMGLLILIVVLLVVFRPAKNESTSHWKLRVYDFDNWSEIARGCSKSCRAKSYLG
jgi:hypothetical protein